MPESEHAGTPELAAPTGLVESVRYGLSVVPSSGQNWAAHFDAEIAADIANPDDAAVRTVAASILREVVKEWILVPGREGNLWNWVTVGKRRFGTLRSVTNPADFKVEVLVNLSDIIGRWERAEGAWGPTRFTPGQEKWFPVRPDMSFDKWVWENTVSAAGRMVKRAERNGLISSADNSDLERWAEAAQQREGYEIDVAPWLFDPYRSAVMRILNEDLTVFSPDIAGSEEARAKNRQEMVRTAALAASSRLLDSLEDPPDRLRSPATTCTDAVRQTDPHHPGLDQHATRMVADVLFAVTEALRVAADELGCDESIPPPVKAAVRLIMGHWRYAQLEPVADLMCEVLINSVRLERAQGTVAWSADLAVDLVACAPGTAAARLAKPFIDATLQFLAKQVTAIRLGVRDKRPRLEIAATAAAGLAPGPIPRWIDGQSKEAVVGAAIVAYAARLREFDENVGRADETQETS